MQHREENEKEREKKNGGPTKCMIKVMPGDG